MRPRSMTRELMTRSLISAALAALAAPALAREETYVTTYVVKVQEERESTRWTLTEWLRIKERMKMMDVWLAMFSDPKKDRFQPELMLSYGMTRGHFKYDAGAGSQDAGALSGTEGKAQVWLTNLISSTVGWRTLNIDLGVEGYKRQAVDLVAGSASSSAGATSANATAATSTGGTSAALDGGRTLDTQYYSGDLRIFGKNIQDSSLVLKYGQYTAHNTILDAVGTPDAAATRGSMAGAEVQLYFLRFLGAEGDYLRFGDASAVKGSATQSGEYYDYMGFVEFSLLRVMAGVYGENWTVERQGEAVKSQEKGSLAALKLQF